MPLVISLLELLSRAGDSLAFGPDGERSPVAVPTDRPALLVVEPVADALKRVSGGRVLEPVDRGSVDRVVAFSVDRELLASLGPVEVTPEELIELVQRGGHTWERYRLA